MSNRAARSQAKINDVAFIEKIQCDKITPEQAFKAICRGEVANISTIEQSLQELIDRAKITDDDARQLVEYLIAKEQGIGNSDRESRLGEVLDKIIDGFQANVITSEGPDAYRELIFKGKLQDIPEYLNYATLNQEEAGRMSSFLSDMTRLAKKYGCSESYSYTTFQVLEAILEIDVQADREVFVERENGPASVAMEEILKVLIEYQAKVEMKKLSIKRGTHDGLERAREILRIQKGIDEIMPTIHDCILCMRKLRSTNHPGSQYTQLLGQIRNLLSQRLDKIETEKALEIVNEQINHKKKSKARTLCALSFTKEIVARKYKMSAETIEKDCSKYRARIESGEIPLFPSGLRFSWHGKERRLISGSKCKKRLTP